MRKITLILTLSIVVFLAIPSYAGDEFVEQHCWRFENTTYFTDAGEHTVLPWEIFTRSFIGICSDSNDAKAQIPPLDYAFYKAYNAAFAVTAGNCFGMSLLANIIYKEEGHMGFCKPIYTYSGDFDGPASPKLDTVITIMQCHEWSHAGIMWMVENMDLTTGSHAKDPNYAYTQIDYYLSMGDLPLVTLVRDLSFVGHTLIPYRVEETSTKRYIYLHDPNKWYPHDSLFYDNHENYIEINTSTGSWSYKFDDTETWDSPDGYIFATPMSIVKPSSRNPLQLGCAQDALNDIFLTGANISQITDDEGHKFYKTSASSHNRLSEIEDNPSIKLKNIIRMPMTFASARRASRRRGNAPEIYFTRGYPGKNLNFEIASTGKNYKFEMAGKDNIIRLAAPGGSSGRDNFEIKNLSTNNQELILSSRRGAAKFVVELHQTIPGSKVARLFKVTNLQAPSSSPVRLRLAEGRDALLVKGEKSAVSCNLEITQVVDGKVTKMPSRAINVSGKEWQQIIPSNWNKLNGSTIKVNKLKMPIDPLGKSTMPPDPLDKKR